MNHLRISTLIFAGLWAGFGCTPQQERAQQEQSLGEHFTPCHLRLSDVREERVTPEEYVASLEQCLPEVQKAKEKGIVRHLLYEPREDALEEELRDLLSLTGMPEKRLLHFVEENKNRYYQSKNALILYSILPDLSSEYYGKHLSNSMVLTSSLFSSPWVTEEEDLRSLLHQGLQNSKDFYEGLSVSPELAAQQTSGKIPVALELLSLLMKLRAIYKGLEEQFLHRIELGRFSCSDSWFINQANMYYRTWQRLQEYPVDKVEYLFRAEQFQYHKRILPIVDESILVLRFQLFGKDETVSIPFVKEVLAKKE